MSETPPPPHQPPLDNARRYRIATEIIHSILDDRPPTATVSPSGELYRAIERFHRNVDRVRREIPAYQRPGETTMSAGSERDLRRRFGRSPQGSSGALDDMRVELPSISPNGSLPPLPTLPPLRSLGSRPFGSRRLLPTDNPRERLHWTDLNRERHRRLMTDNRNPTSATSSAETLERLEDANSHLRTLLDFTETSPILPSHPPRETSPLFGNHEPHDEGRRPKRRRLDSDRTAQQYRGFRYGKYGQSEPGQLKMELVSCDGGLYSNTPEYAAENILRNDRSVYCTKGNRCNIVLQHQGATVFSMSELIIKAPGTAFSSPVSEGMLFMSMESNDIFYRTASYQIQYLSSTDINRLAAERENRSIHAQPAVYSIRHGEDGARVTRLPPVWAQSYDGHHRIDFDGDEDGDDDMEAGRPQIAQLPHEFTLPPPPFTITSECSTDDADGEEDGNGGLHRSRSFPRLQIPNRIGTLPFESDEDDEDGGGEDVWVPSNLGGGWAAFDEVARGNRASYDRRRPARAAIGSQPPREDSQSSRSLQEAREASQIATQEAVRAVGGDLMTPLVHFHIEEHNKCTIRFDPPVSGRFLLLKMWSSRNGQNIDIQGVTVKGFAGPRYVPDIEYR